MITQPDIKILNDKSGLMIAISDKVPGILAHGKNVDELQAELEAVLKYLVNQK